MTTDWSQKMTQTLQLNGKGERTREAYVRTVRMLRQFYDKSPELISEEELQNYFLHRKNVNHWSPQTMRICYCGIRFFYTNVLQHDWHIFNILRAQTEHRLPAVLSEEEVLEAGINLRSIQQFLGQCPPGDHHGLPPSDQQGAAGCLAENQRSDEGAVICKPSPTSSALTAPSTSNATETACRPTTGKPSKP